MIWLAAFFVAPQASAQPPTFSVLASDLKAAAQKRDVRGLKHKEEEMLQYYPQFPPTLPVIAKQWMYLRFEHSTHAVSLLERFRKLHPDILDIPLLLNHAYLLLELGRCEEAIESLVLAVENEPSEGQYFADARRALAEQHILKATPTSLLGAAQLLVPVVRPHQDDRIRDRYAMLAKTPETAVAVFRLGECVAALPNTASSISEELHQLVSELVNAVLDWISLRDSSRLPSLPVSGLWHLSASVESIEIDPRESTWESSLTMALKRSSKARTPLRVSYPMDATVTSVWEALRWKVQNWDTTYLRQTAGKQYVYASCKHEQGSLEFGFSSQRRLMRFRKFVDRLEDGRECYLNVQGMKGEVYQPPLQKGLDADVPVPSILPLGRHFLDRVTLWMGNASGIQLDECGNDGTQDKTADCACTADSGSLSRFHHDNQDNVIVLLQGIKQYALFPPRHASNLYTVGKISHIEPSGVIRYMNDFGADAHGEHFSLATNIFQPSNDVLKRFPALRQALADGGTVTLGPGQMLYIPAGWFHQVRSCSTHIALNFWWDV